MTKENIDKIMNEINQIKDDDIRQWTLDVMNIIPQKFFELPPSKSGMWHPEDEFCPNGSVIHSKRVFYTMKVICDSMANILTDIEIDECLSAALIHDSCTAYGRSHADDFYPHLIKEMGPEFANMYPNIVRYVTEHMGRWGKNPPSDQRSLMVHLADNIAAKLEDIWDSGYKDMVLEKQTGRKR